MERSENEIVAAPPFSTVQVKPPRFFCADALKSLGITGVQVRAVCPVGQNGQVAGRRGTQIFLKRTIVFALLDGVLLAFDLRELVYRAAGDQQSSGDTNDEQGVSLRNFWRGGR